MMIDTTTIYTTTQVAHLLGVRSGNIKNYCRLYDNIGFKIKHKGLPDSGWLLTAENVKWIKSRIGKKGDKLT